MIDLIISVAKSPCLSLSSVAGGMYVGFRGDTLSAAFTPSSLKPLSSELNFSTNSMQDFYNIF